MNLAASVVLRTPTPVESRQLKDLVIKGAPNDSPPCYRDFTGAGTGKKEAGKRRSKGKGA